MLTPKMSTRLQIFGTALFSPSWMVFSKHLAFPKAIGSFFCRRWRLRLPQGLDVVGWLLVDDYRGSHQLYRLRFRPRLPSDTPRGALRVRLRNPELAVPRRTPKPPWQAGLPSVRHRVHHGGDPFAEGTGGALFGHLGADAPGAK